MAISYTAHANANIQKHIDSCVRTYARVATDIIGADSITSIILSGGFGRGEGSVIVTPQNQVLPLSDFDVYVVTDDAFSKTNVPKLQGEIDRAFKQVIGWDTAYDQYFDATPSIICTSDLRRLTSNISHFEMKHASRVLAGSDLRRLIPVQACDVSAADGALTMFHRMIYLMHSLECLRTPPDSSELYLRAYVNYQSTKALVEICSALCLVDRIIVPSYEQRAREFENSKGRAITTVLGRHPELVGQINEAVRRKLYSTKLYEDDTVALWKQAYQTVKATFPDFLELWAGQPQNPDLLEENADQYLHALSSILDHRLLAPYVQSYVRRMTGARLPFQFCEMIGPLADSFRHLNGQLRPLAHNGPIPTSPLSRIYVSVALLFQALHIEGTLQSFGVNENWVDASMSNLSSDQPLCPGGMWEKWQVARQMIMEYFKTYYGVLNTF